MRRYINSVTGIVKKMKGAAGWVILASLLAVLPEKATAGMKPIVQKVFKEFINSVRHPSGNSHYPNLAILKVKVMPNGKIGIAIVHQDRQHKGIAGQHMSDFTVPFEKFYRKTTINIYRFDHKKERFALWERHTLQQLDPMKSSIPGFYQKAGSNFSFVTDKTFQGRDYFGIVIESPQPESRYDDNSKLIKLISPLHKQKRRPADLVIMAARVKSAGKYCYPVVRIINRGGTISDKAWQGHGARLTLFFRSNPTQPWKVFDTKTFAEIDPGKKLQKNGRDIIYTVDRAIDKSYHFKIVIDEKNNIPESDEANNQKELILACSLHTLPLPHSKTMGAFQKKDRREEIKRPKVHSRQPFEVPQRIPQY